MHIQEKLGVVFAFTSLLAPVVTNAAANDFCAFAGAPVNPESETILRLDSIRQALHIANRSESIRL